MAHLMRRHSLAMFQRVVRQNEKGPTCGALLASGQLLWQLVEFHLELQAVGVSLIGEVVHYLCEQPVGLVNLWLEPSDGGGLFRVELGASPGQGDLKLGHPSLQLFPLGPGGPHGVGLAGVDVTQFLDVLAAADQQLVLLPGGNACSSFFLRFTSTFFFSAALLSCQ